MRALFAALGGFLGLSLTGIAAATPPLSVQRYSLEEGLSQQAVVAIAQDAEGFMWFGTEDGLNRFDGYEFRQLRHDRGDQSTLPNGWIASLPRRPSAGSISTRSARSSAAAPGRGRTAWSCTTRTSTR